jgi:hypothetical protein
METYVWRFVADYVGFPKLEAMLSTMSDEEFSDCMAYTHLKVILLIFVFSFGLLWWNDLPFVSLQGLFLGKALKNKRNFEA